MLKNISILVGFAVALSACGLGGPSNANFNNEVNREIKLDPANMPPGLSATPLPSSANLPPGISLNAVNIPIGNKPIPGIPTAEQLKKGFKPGKTSTPGIPDAETIRKQMGLSATNVNASPTRSGGKP